MTPVDQARQTFQKWLYLPDTGALDITLGAIAATLPRALRSNERCWIVGPHEWKTGLGLKAKPTGEDVTRLAPTHTITVASPSSPPLPTEPGWQNGLDAYCLALWARNTNAQAIAAA